MERDLREHFERAVGDDPGVAPGELAIAAISEGGRLRRRRHRLTAAGVVALAGAMTGLYLPMAGDAPDRPATVAAAMMPVAAKACTEHPVERDATDVLVFLDRAAADRQRAALGAALDADPRVTTVIFDSRAQAYERFQVLWQNEPDLLQAVNVDSFPESFRLRLAAASEYTAFRSQYAAMEGVGQILGRRCPADAPVGGVR